MPDKEGSDDEKTTKGVVNKKQKQMMGEEGYDILRDMGRVKPSKDKKDATTMPVSDEVRKTQKVNTGPSALDRVLKKYGKSVMNVEKKSKKKANEELDLTKIAEAFGGYVIEQDIPDPWSDKSETPEKKKKAKKQFDKDVAQEPDTDAKEDEFATGTQKPKPVVKKTQAKNYKPKTTGRNIRGGQGIKLNPFSGTVNPKTGKVVEPEVKIIQKGSTAAKQAQKVPVAPKQSTAAKLSDRKSTDEFQKDLAATGETMGSEGMKSDAEKITKRQGKKAVRAVEGGGKKTGGLKKGNLQFSGDKSYKKLKDDMKGKELTAADLYQQRMQQAFDVGSGAPRFIPSSQPLPAAPKGTKKGQPQKVRPKDEPAVQSGVYSGKGVGRQEKVPTNIPQETGRRASQSKDPSLERAAQTGINPRTNEYYPDTEEGRKLRKLDFQTGKGGDSDAVKNVAKNLTKGGMPRSELDRSGGFDSGREGESITRRPPRQEVSPKSPNVKVNVNVNQKGQVPDFMTSPQKLGKKATDTATDLMSRQSRSAVGAMGGIIGKSAVPASAGYEAGVNLSRGDRFGAALSLGQSLGGATGFAFGVLNALRMRAPGYQVPKPRSPKFDPKTGGKLATKGQVSMDKETGEGEAMMGAGGAALSNVLRRVRQAQGLAQKGYQGRTGFISAQGGGGL